MLRMCSLQIIGWLVSMRLARYILVAVSFAVLLWIFVPVQYHALERFADERIARKVASWPFLSSTLDRVLLSVPSVESCRFRGQVECVPFTSEGSVECILVLTNGIETRFVFNLLGRHLYPGTLRTKQLVEALESQQGVSDSNVVMVTSILVASWDGQANRESFCSPQVLNAKPLLARKGTSPMK
jgi:hypothetical protein